MILGANTNEDRTIHSEADVKTNLFIRTVCVCVGGRLADLCVGVGAPLWNKWKSQRSVGDVAAEHFGNSGSGTKVDVGPPSVVAQSKKLN